MLSGIRRMGLDSLPWSHELRDWQARVLALRGWFPEDGWPDLSDAWLVDHLDDWLAPWLDGISRREHLQRLDLATALHGLLDGRLRARLNELAPTYLQVPSGFALAAAVRAGRTAGAGGEVAGIVRAGRYPAHRRRADCGDAAPAVAGAAADSGDAGSARLLGTDLRRGQKGVEGPLPQASWPDDPWTATPTRRTQATRRSS